jgi:eukaryotic-like serine/threonine-protein kinase
MQLHIQRGPESMGTFSLEETSQHLAEGRLLETDLAWHEGLEDWKSLGQLHPGLLAQAETMVAEGGKGPARSEIPALERYKKEKLLGEGGMGQVWLAYDKQLERQVALKMVSGGQAVDTLRREVHGCLELTHPHIIRIYDLVILPGEDPFISMEYIEGEDLTHKAKQKEGERFSWQELEPYILSLCDGLAYAHDQGMVHRDIKPQNLMITKENELKLADFGIAAPLQEEDEESDIQVPRAGTPIYWSPQQAQGMNPTPTDDIYALGVTLFHLLVGEPPFKGANEPALTYQHINEEPPHPQDKLKELGGEGKIPGYVSELILKCLAKKPTERFQGAGDVQAWIKAKGDPVVKRQKRMALVSGVMGVVALAMGALAIWAFNQRTEAEVQKGIAETKQLQAVEARDAEAKQRQEAERAKEKEAKQRQEAEEAKEESDKQKKKAEQQNYFHVIALAQSRIEEGAYSQAEAMLWATPKEHRNWEWGHLMQVCHPELLTLRGHGNRVTTSVAFSPDGRRVVTGGHRLHSKDLGCREWQGIAYPQGLYTSHGGWTRGWYYSSRLFPGWPARGDNEFWHNEDL